VAYETEGHASDTDSKPLSGTVQLDDVYWGGERRGGKRGRGAANKVPLVAAVSLNGDGHPISMNMNVVKGFRLTEIARLPTIGHRGQNGMYNPAARSFQTGCLVLQP